jgi:hypothetical protein
LPASPPRPRRAATSGCATLDPRRFRQEFAALRSVFNSAWEANWGFVPIDEAEMEWHASRLRHLIDPRIALIVEARRGERVQPAAFALAIPDVIEILLGLDGRLTPRAILRLVRGQRHVRTMRLLLLGVAAPFRRRGVECAAHSRDPASRSCRRVRPGGRVVGAGRQCVMNKSIVKAGGRHYKTFRIYAKTLT